LLLQVNGPATEKWNIKARIVTNRLARCFIGNKVNLRQRYREGQEDQLSALGLAVKMIVLWDTLYINAALEQLAGN